MGDGVCKLHGWWRFWRKAGPVLSLTAPAAPLPPRRDDPAPAVTEEDKRKARLVKLAAWRKEKGIVDGGPGGASEAAPSLSAGPEAATVAEAPVWCVRGGVGRIWRGGRGGDVQRGGGRRRLTSRPPSPALRTPWDDGTAAAAAPSSASGAPSTTCAPAPSPPAPPNLGAGAPSPAPAHIAALKAATAAAAAAAAAAPAPADDDIDPLDAFMASEVLPEVAAREAEERAAREAALAAAAADRAAGKGPPKSLEKLLADLSDEEEVADAKASGRSGGCSPSVGVDARRGVCHGLVCWRLRAAQPSDTSNQRVPTTPHPPQLPLQVLVPANKVKRVIGPGGETIKLISKKSKCRVQVTKSDAELARGFGGGGGGEAVGPGPAGDGEGDDAPPSARLVTIDLFGTPHQCEVAERLIQEAVENREQKSRQRAAAYDRKKEERWRSRQLYHLRHARDYEALGLAVGASKEDVKRAFRQARGGWWGGGRGWAVGGRGRGARCER